MFNIPCILSKMYRYPLSYDASYRHESSPFFFSYFFAASWKFVTHSFTSGSFMRERVENNDQFTRSYRPFSRLYYVPRLALKFEAELHCKLVLVPVLFRTLGQHPQGTLICQFQHRIGCLHHDSVNGNCIEILLHHDELHIFIVWFSMTEFILFMVAMVAYRGPM